MKWGCSASAFRAACRSSSPRGSTARKPSWPRTANLPGKTPYRWNSTKRSGTRSSPGISGAVDAVAFQDGHIDYDELDTFFAVNKQLADKYGMQCWTNAESFDRDMPIKFLPIKFDKLRMKLEAAQRAGYDQGDHVRVLALHVAAVGLPAGRAPLRPLQGIFRNQVTHERHRIHSVSVGGGCAGRIPLRLRHGRNLGTISMVTTQFGLNVTLQGWYVGCALVGSIAGVSFAGMLSDRFGRKISLSLAALFFTVSAAGCAVSADITQLIVYRIIGGVGIGVASDHLAHVYQRDRRRQTPGTPRVALPAGHHHRLPRSLHRQLRPAELCRTGYADGHALEQGLHHRAVARHAGRRDPPGTALPRDPLLHPREPGDGSSPGAGPTAPSPSRRASAAARPTPAANWAKPSSGSNATKARNGNSCCARTC